MSDASPQQLQTAGSDYPDSIQDDYTQVPDSTPGRVGERTERLTANADTPYQTSRVVEQYLESNKNYSLDVDRPRGNVADSFRFEMDAGYCTYYATAMVTMLRTQTTPPASSSATRPVSASTRTAGSSVDRTPTPGSGCTSRTTAG